MVKTKEWKQFKKYASQLILDNLNTNYDKNFLRGIKFLPEKFEEDLKNGKFVGKDVESALKTTLASKLRDAWMEEFFDYYNNPTLTAEEVTNNNYTEDDVPVDINQKFATMAGLLSANIKQVKACREFIEKYCDPEYLSVFDIYWAGNDIKRMEKITELQELSKLNKQEEGDLDNEQTIG